MTKFKFSKLLRRPKPGKDKLKNSQDEKPSQQVCFSVLKYMYTKMVTMVDSYKQKAKWLPLLFSVYVFLEKNIFEINAVFGNDNFK